MGACLLVMLELELVLELVLYIYSAMGACLLVMLRRVLVGGFLLHYETHVLPRLGARLVVLQAALAQLLGQVVLACEENGLLSGLGREGVLLGHVASHYLPDRVIKIKCESKCNC